MKISRQSVSINIKELNDEYGSYICEHGYLHDYSRLNLDDLETDRKTYNSVNELKNEIEGE